MPISGRRRIAESNFLRAKNRLRKRLNRSSQTGLDQILLDDSDLNCSGTVESMADAVETVVERFMEVRKAPRQSSNMEKVQEIMRTWIRVSYPYVQVFLGVSKTGSNVRLNNNFFSLTNRFPEVRMESFATAYSVWSR
jgi:vacuolar-type H+-ATPase subunit E/Vma4